MSVISVSNKTSGSLFIGGTIGELGPRQSTTLDLSEDQIGSLLSRLNKLRDSGQLSYTISSDQLQSLPFQDPFGASVSVQRRLIGNLIPTYGLSSLRNKITAAGSASADESAGEGKLTLTADGADEVAIETVQHFPYVSGRVGEAGIGIRVPTAPTGNQVYQWGLFTINEGYYLGWDSTGIFVGRRKNGEDFKAYQSEWNVDKLDGRGDSRELLTEVLRQGAIFHINYSWYGYGTIEFSVHTSDNSGQLRPIVMHRVFGVTGLSIQDPSLPIRIEAANNGSAVAGELFFGGRQYSIIGDVDFFQRFGSVFNSLGAVSSLVPICSFKRKALFRGRVNSVSLTLDGFSVMGSDNLRIQIIGGGTLTGASFTDQEGLSAVDSAAEVDVSATAVANGKKLYEDLLPNAQGNSINESDLHNLVLEVPGEEPITLAVQSLGAAASVQAVLRWRERW